MTALAYVIGVVLAYCVGVVVGHLITRWEMW